MSTTLRLTRAAFGAGRAALLLTAASRHQQAHGCGHVRRARAWRLFRQAQLRSRVRTGRSSRSYRAWPGAELVTTAGLGHHRIVSDPGVIGPVVSFLRGEAS